MNNFLDITETFRQYSLAKFVVLPCPYEATTSYEKGTKNGPAAILKASQYLELFDEELAQETYRKSGIHTLQSIGLNQLNSAVKQVLKDEKLPVILGGEHSLSLEPIKAAKEKYPSLSVLQFDAHADLRDEYYGRKDSHACVMRRALEVCPAVQVGIRSLSAEEWDFAQKSGQDKKIHFAEHLDVIEKITTQLSDEVYITFDVDVFDPSIVPSTGTPEPGGLFWYEILDILREVCKIKKVVGIDFVELLPIKGLHAPDFTIAKLIYKVMGYIASR